MCQFLHHCPHIGHPIIITKYFLAKRRYNYGRAKRVGLLDVTLRNSPYPISSTILDGSLGWMHMNDNNNLDHLHILIVDDEELIRQSLQQTVNRSGYNCSASKDGKEALAVLDNRSVDVVITDIKMEGMDGIELLKRVKEKHDADVIVMTGFAGDYSYEDIIETGASDFVLKPLSAGEIIVRLKRVLRERSLKAEMTKAHKELKSSHKELVRTLVALIEEKDMLMKGHAERVAGGCVHFSRKLGLSKNVIEKTYFAGLLHDLGKVYLPGELFIKTDQLDEDGIKKLQQHPEFAEKILSNISMLKHILPIIRHHHEAFDGSGYPDGLKGDNIPIEAQILGLVNSFDNIMSAGSNGNSLTEQESVQKLAKSANRQFDPGLVKDFVLFKKETVDGLIEPVTGEAEGKEMKGSIREALFGIMQKYKNGEIELPVLPKIVQEIQGVINNPVSTVDNLIQVIERDAAISIKLISIANSPIYRGTDKYTTVKEALPRLGVKEIQNIISAIATKSLYETKNNHFKKLMEKLWVHALASGYCARAIAKNLMFGDQDKIFFMGLLHDVGKLPLLKSLSEVFSNNGSPNMEEVVSNVQAIHSSFGGIVLERWGFGKEYIEIARQHDKDEFPEGTEKAVLIVSLANVLTRKLGYSLLEDDIDPSETESAKTLELEPETLDTIFEKTEQIMQDSGCFN